MIIGLDGNEANEKVRVGIHQYAYNLLLKLNQLDKKNQYVVYLKNPPSSDMPKSSPNWQYKVFGPQKFWTRFALPLHLYTQKQKLDLFFSPGHYTPWLCPFPIVPTIHDLGYLYFKDQFTKKDLYQLINWTDSSIKKAVHIFCVSEFTKKEIIKLYHIDPVKITVAYNGVGEPVFDKNTLSKFNLTDPYFLYLGTLKPSKNIPFLIKSFAKYIKHHRISEHKLVIAGKKGWLFEDIFNTVRLQKIEDRVIFTDYVTEAEKWTLLKNASATVIPSLYEGFGIPVIESMKVGTPVIASNIPSLKEVVGDAGIYIDPKNKNSLSLAFKKILRQEVKKSCALAGYKQAKKFTWDNTADSVLKTIDRL